MKTEGEGGRCPQLGSQLVDASVHLLFVPPFEVKRDIMEPRKDSFIIQLFPQFEVAAFVNLAKLLFFLRDFALDG